MTQVLLRFGSLEVVAEIDESAFLHIEKYITFEHEQPIIHCIRKEKWYKTFGNYYRVDEKNQVWRVFTDGIAVRSSHSHERISFGVAIERPEWAS